MRRLVMSRLLSLPARRSGEERAYHHYELRPVDIRRQEVDSGIACA